jgi:hypothetical protein
MNEYLPYGYGIETERTDKDKQIEEGYQITDDDDWASVVGETPYVILPTTIGTLTEVDLSTEDVIDEPYTRPIWPQCVHQSDRYYGWLNFQPDLIIKRKEQTNDNI